MPMQGVVFESKRWSSSWVMLGITRVPCGPRANRNTAINLSGPSSTDLFSKRKCGPIGRYQVPHQDLGVVCKAGFWKLRGLASRHKFFSTGNLESNRGMKGNAAALNPASGFESLQFERHTDSNNSSRRLLHQA